MFWFKKKVNLFSDIEVKFMSNLLSDKMEALVRSNKLNNDDYIYLNYLKTMRDKCEIWLADQIKWDREIIMNTRSKSSIDERKGD